MKLSFPELGRRTARWCAALLIAPLGLLTFVLFISTGKPIPSGFLPADQIAFTLDEDGDTSGKPIYWGPSQSAQCLIATTALEPDEQNNGDSNSDNQLVSVFDPVTMQSLGSFRDNKNRLLFFEISPDRKTLFSATSSRLLIRDLATGKKESAEIVTPWGDLGESELAARVTLASDGKRILINTRHRAVCFDLLGRRTIAAFQLPAYYQIMTCFFDADACPKVLVYGLDLEVWDLARNQMDLALDQSELEKRDLLRTRYECYSISATEPVLATLSSEANFLLVRSLQDGRSLQTYSVPADSTNSVRFSPDGEFVLIDCVGRNRIASLAERRMEGLDEWLERIFPWERNQTLLSLRTGRTWPGLAGDGRCRFVEDGSHLISFTKDGRYEYDVPPRWRYFTPWAWAALGVWLIMIGVWWKLRRRQQVAAVV